MIDKEIQESVTRLKAYAECFRMKTRCTTPYKECNSELCDSCNLLYAQGTVAEHLKDIETAIRVLEKEPCEDAVSRQRVIEELRYMDNNGCITRSVNHVIDDIRSIPSVKPLENQPQWIPVSERLPETDEDVLITDGVTVYIGWINATNRQWRANSEDNCFINNVTAYMPLPEPYKGDEDD